MQDGLRLEEELAISCPDLQVSMGRKDICQASPGDYLSRARLVSPAPWAQSSLRTAVPWGIHCWKLSAPCAESPSHARVQGPEMLFRKVESIQAALAVAAELLPWVWLLCLINSVPLIFNLSGLIYNMNSGQGFFFEIWHWRFCCLKAEVKKSLMIPFAPLYHDSLRTSDWMLIKQGKTVAALRLLAQF